MIVELDRGDLINLVRSTSPGYEMMDRFERPGLGYYVGGFADRWEWNSLRSGAWDDFTEEELFELYKELKRG